MGRIDTVAAAGSTVASYEYIGQQVVGCKNKTGVKSFCFNKLMLGFSSAI
jgi:hypothetical protein